MFPMESLSFKALDASLKIFNPFQGCSMSTHVKVDNSECPTSHLNMDEHQKDKNTFINYFESKAST